MIEVREVITKKDYKAFFAFPLKLYKNNKFYTPPLYGDDKKDFDVKRNPNLKVCQIKSFIAFKDGKIVGRICAVYNPPADLKYHTKRLRFRHFDVIDDFEVTKALFKEVMKLKDLMALLILIRKVCFLKDLKKEIFLLHITIIHIILLTWKNWALKKLLIGLNIA